MPVDQIDNPLPPLRAVAERRSPHLCAIVAPGALGFVVVAKRGRKYVELLATIRVETEDPGVRVGYALRRFKRSS